MSVVVVNYNYARFLHQSIGSALAQTYPRVEVVVVDDGSTDESRAVIQSYGDQVRPVLKANGGSISATKIGLEVVQGDFVVLLDADDALFPDVVERAVAEFTADPACGRVQWRLQVLDDKGVPRPQLVPPTAWPLRTGDLAHDVMQYRLFRSPPTSGNAWSTRVLREVPRPPDEIFAYVDRWYGELAALAATTRALQAPGGFYRVHSSSHHVTRGKGARYFRDRIELTEQLHAAGAEVAARRGLVGYPSDVFEPLDAAFLAWHLAVHKLTAERPERPVRWLALRGARAALSQPDHPRRSRAARAAWFLALGIAPAGGRLAARLVASRYDRGTQ